MPQSALRRIKVDHCVPIAKMGRLIAVLTHEPAGRSRRVDRDIRTEAEIAERVLSDVAQANGLGSQVPYNCPNCGGVLWEMNHPDLERFRCHTGHAFTAAALFAAQSERIEETLWISLRMLEERKNLLQKMSDQEPTASGRRAFSERARETEVHIKRIRVS